MLSENDLRRLLKALQGMNEDSLEMTLGGVRVRASVRHAGKAWTVAMLIRMEVWRRGIYSSQYFESVEQLRKALRKEQI